MPTQEGNVLIFEEPTKFTVKHPLQSQWTLWYDDAAAIKLNPKITWDENLKNVLTVDSVEDFWGLINNLKKPSELPNSANYHLFKKGVRPAWEDPVNSKGGKWTYTVHKSKKSELDDAWLSTVTFIN